MRCCTTTNSGVWPETMSEESLEHTVTWAELLEETTGLLRRAEIENASMEARWIVEQATGTTGSEIVEVLAAPATVRTVQHLDQMVARRTAGEPIQYVLGSWSFRSLDLMVDRRVLIPRPETEIVAGLAIAEIDRLHPDGGGVVIDLGTGSGAIGLSIAAERAVERALLTDASTDALSVARANLAGLGMAGRAVEISHGSWFDAVPDSLAGQIDVIVSNPPYVPTGDELPSAVLDWEPQSALLAGSDGLADLRIIVSESARWLRPEGALVLEMDPRQVPVVSESLREAGFDVSVHRDLPGLERALVARWIA